MFERYPTNRSELHNHLQPHRQLQEWGKGERQIPVKQKALAEKQSLAAVWSINTLLAVIFSLLQWQINTFIAVEDALITFIPALYALLRCF